MSKTLHRFIATTVMVGAAMFGVTSSGDAAFRLRVESGTSTGPGVVITYQTASDNQTVFDASSMTFVNSGATPNYIGINVINLGPFMLSGTIGTSTPFLSAPGFYEAIDLNNVTISSNAGGTLRLILEQTGLGASTPLGAVTFKSDVGGVLTAPLGSSITFASYIDSTGAVPVLGPDGATSTAVTGIGPGSASLSQTFTPPPGNFSGSTGTQFTNTGSYSIYTVVTVNFEAGGGSVSFNQITGTTPAPAGLILALAGMPTLGLGVWLRRRRVSTPV